MKSKKILYIILAGLIVVLALSVVNFTIKAFKDKDIDVIDINTDDKDKTPKDKTDKDDKSKTNDDTKKDTQPTGGSGNGSGSGSGSGEGSSEEESKEDERFVVNDKDKEWAKQTNIKIFDVSKIAPGDSGKYEFFINNKTNYPSKYNIEFIETNIYSANVMYKLKRNGEYIAGDNDTWVKYDELDVLEKELSSKNKDLYKIEWKWVHSDDDTRVGVVKNATYQLSINVNYIAATDGDGGSGSGSDVYTGDKIYYYVILAVSSLIVLILLFIRKRQKD